MQKLEDGGDCFAEDEIILPFFKQILSRILILIHLMCKQEILNKKQQHFKN